MGRGSRPSHSQGRGQQSSPDSEGEDEPESESSSCALSNFRKEWEAELQRISVSGQKNNTPTQFPPISPARPPSFSPRQESSSDSPTAPVAGREAVIDAGTIEEEAKRFFLMGVCFERRGDLYDAVRYYRRAVQLVPDIEYRVNQNENVNSEQQSVQDSDGEMNDAEDEAQDEEENDQGPLTTRFLQMIEANHGQFFEKNRPDTKAHVSDIPVEILLYILR